MLTSRSPQTAKKIPKQFKGKFSAKRRSEAIRLSERDFLQEAKVKKELTRIEREKILKKLEASEKPAEYTREEIETVLK